MKKVVFLAVAVMMFATSCTTVQSGHKGVEISWGGETNLNIVHPEGMSSGVHWIWDDMIEYDVREKTIVQSFSFNDKDNMETGIEVALDYNLHPNKVNLLHTQITDVETKILKTLKSAAKEVIPKYSAVELNLTKRGEAEKEMARIISEELPEFYVEFARLQMTDVDIPKKVAALAEETAVQIGRNELATKKESEQISLAKARVASAEGDYNAAMFEAKTKDIMSQPKMLKLLELEVEMMWAKKGVSKYGANNVFGAGVLNIKNL